MSSKYAKNPEPITFQALIDENQTLSDENQTLSDENHALKDEIESLRARLAEAEELKRAISEGDLDALVIPRPEGELIFTLDSADRAYRVLVETMNEGTATLAYDGTILYCNRRFAELLRMPSQAIVGTSIYQFIAPESTVDFNALLKHKMNAGEVNLRAEGGKSLPVYLSVSSLQTEGSPNAWCLVVTDLTEQKKSEKILASERLARSIIEQSAETIIVCDTSGRITHFSNSMPKLCGCDPTLQRFEDLINLRFSEGADAGKSILPISATLKGSTIIGMEATFGSENYQRFHLLLNSAPLKNKDGEIRGCVVTLTDITERKKTEEELQHAYARLRTIFDHKIDGIGIVIVNENGEVLEANDYYLRILGFSREELEEGFVRWLDATPPEWLSMDEKAIAEFREHGICTPYEKEYIRRDGTRIPVLIAGSMFPGDRGEILGFVVDITERKLAEEAFHTSKESYRRLFNSIDEGFCIIEKVEDEAGQPLDFRFIEANPAFVVQSGVGGVVEKTIRQAFPEEPEEWLDTYDTVLRTGKSIRFERVFASQGRVLELYAFRVEDETTRRVAVIFKDITKRKRAEEALNASEARYRSLYENSLDGILLTNPDGTILSANPQACDLFGMTEHGIIQAGREGLVIKDEKLAAALKERELTGRVKSELTCRRKDGSTVICDVASNLFTDADGNIKTSMIIRDITESKRAAEKLQKSEEHYRMLFTNMTEAFFLAEILYNNDNKPYDYRYLEINPAYELVTGIKKEQLLGKSRLEVFPASYISIEKLSEVALSGQSTHFEIFSPAIDKYLDIYVFKFEKGKIAGIFRDITERKKTEQALYEAYKQIQNQSEELQTSNEELQAQSKELRSQAEELKEANEALYESEDRLRLLGDNLPDSAVYQYMHEPDGSVRFVYCSAGIERLNGISVSDVLRDPGMLHRQIPLEYFERLIEAEARSARELSDFNMEIPMRLPDGQMRWMRLHSRPRRLPDGRTIWDGVQIDINDRKRAEEALLKSEKRNRMLLDHSVDGIVMSDPRDGGKILLANPAACRMLGWAKEELIGKGRDVMFDLQDPALSVLLDERARTGSAKIQLTYRRKDGSTFPGDVTTAFFTDSNGEPRTVAVIRDITERQQAEEVLRKSEERYRMLFTNMTESFFLTEILYNSDGKPYDYRYLEINPTFELYLGVKREQVLGKTMLELFPNVSPIAMEKYSEVVLSGQATNFEIFSQVANKYLDFYTFSPEKGKLAGIFRDITERKQLEEQISQRAEELEMVMEVAPVAIWVGHDQQSHNITGNRMANEFYKAEVGENVSANITPKRRFFYKGRELNADELPMQKASLNDIDVRNAEFDVLLPSGEWRALIGSASPLHYAEGCVRGSVGAFIDITEHKRAEKALMQAYKELQVQSEELQTQSEELQTQAEELQEANEALRESEKRFELLSEANALLLSSKDPMAMIQIIAEKVMRHLKCDVFFNYVFGKAQGRLRLNSCGGISPEAAKEIEWLDEGAAICGCVALEGCRIVSEDVQHNGDRRADLVRSMGIQAYACHPLHIGEKTIGTISFGTRSRKGFAEDELALMRTVADQVSVAIERKRAEEELKMALETLRFNEDQFRGLVMNVKSGAALIDEIGRFAVVNPSFMQIFGLDNELDILNVNSQDWSRWEVYGEDGKLLHVDDHPVRKVVSTGKPVKDQLVAVRNPGANELTWMLISAEPILKEDGHIYRMICTYHDITKRKKAEETLKKAHETLEEKVKERTAELEVAYNSLLEKELRLSEAQKIAHLGNWDWNLLTDKLHWSDEIYRIFGLDPLEFGATYHSFLNYVHPDDRDYVENAVKKALNGEPYSIEYRIISPDGENRIVHSQAEVIFDEKHTPVRMRGVLQDITERKRAEEALEKIDKIRIKEIHHRIKNNLQVISSLLDLQAEKFIDEKVREAFKEGQNRVISMALIHEELYKGEGTDRLDFSAYLKKLAQSLFQTYNLSSRNKHLHIDLEENAFFDIDTAVPLGIIVNELVSNSFKHAFIEDDKGEIRIRLSREETNSETNKSIFSLTVSDNGKGIPEYIELENIESLGLQLVSILVDQLDGEVELKRMQGTEFRITFSIEEKYVFAN